MAGTQLDNKGSAGYVCDPDTKICKVDLNVGLGAAYDVPPELIGGGMSERLGEKGLYKAIGFVSEVAAINKSNMTVDFVASTSQKNRNNAMVQQDGWKLDNYLANPVHLWAHDSRSFPIGISESIKISKGQLIQRVRYTPVTGFDFPAVVFELISEGVIRGISVGFMPLEWTFDEEENGIKFIEQELLETSTVPIPADPNALVRRNSFNAGMVAQGLGVIDKEQHESYRLQTPKISFNLSSELDEVDDKIDQTVIPFRKESLAPRDKTWSASKELAKQSTPAGWRRMSTVIVGDRENKGSYKLPHHTGDSFSTVFRGVANALARLNQTDMPSGDRAGARRHLARHRAEFEDEESGFCVDIFEQGIIIFENAIAATEDEKEKLFLQRALARFVEADPDELYPKTADSEITATLKVKIEPVIEVEEEDLLTTITGSPKESKEKNDFLTEIVGSEPTENKSEPELDRPEDEVVEYLTNLTEENNV